MAKQEQRRVAVGPGNAQFISIRHVAFDATTLQRSTCETVVWSAAAAADDDDDATNTTLGSLLIKN